MSDDKMGVTEVAILADMALMMSAYNLAKNFSRAEIDVIFEVMTGRIKDQGLDPKNPVIGKLKEGVCSLNEEFSKEKV